MVTFTPLGGVGEVGASCYLLTVETDGQTRNILIDLGIRNLTPDAIARGASPLPALDALRGVRIDAVLNTHAHADHNGALPLVQRLDLDRRASIYTSIPNAALNRELLPRSASMPGALFTADEVAATSAMTEGLPWRERVPIIAGSPITVTLYPAGHVFGAAIMDIDTGQGTLRIMCDWSLWSPGLIPGANLDELPPVDWLFIETTYGLRTLSDPNQALRNLVLTARELRDAGRSDPRFMVLYSFQLQRAQRLLWELKRANLGLPVYAVGRGIEVISQIMVGHPGEFLPALRNEIAANAQTVFTDPHKRVSFLSARDLPRVVAGQSAIIVRAGGMIPEPAEELLRATAENPNNMTALVGYAAPGTVAYEVARLLDLPPGADRTIQTSTGPLYHAARVISISLSGHPGGDQNLSATQKHIDSNPDVVVMAGHGDARTATHPFAEAARRLTRRPSNILEPTVLTPIQLTSTRSRGLQPTSRRPFKASLLYEFVQAASDDRYARNTRKSEERDASRVRRYPLPQNAVVTPALLAAAYRGSTQPPETVQLVAKILVDHPEYFEPVQVGDKRSGQQAYRARPPEEVARLLPARIAREEMLRNLQPGRLVILREHPGAEPQLRVVTGTIDDKIIVWPVLAGQVAFEPQPASWIDTGVDVADLQNLAALNIGVLQSALQKKARETVDLALLWDAARSTKEILTADLRRLGAAWQPVGAASDHLEDNRELAVAWALAARGSNFWRRAPTGAWVSLAPKELQNPDGAAAHLALVRSLQPGQEVEHTSGVKGSFTGISSDGGIQVEARITDTNGDEQPQIQMWRDNKIATRPPRETPPAPPETPSPPDHAAPRDHRRVHLVPKEAHRVAPDQILDPVFQKMGALFRAHREMAGLTTREVADRLKVSNGYISQIENGQAPGRWPIRLGLAKLYGIEPETLRIDVKRRPEDSLREFVKRALRARGLEAISGLAGELDISPQAVGQMLREGRIPEDRLPQFAHILDVDVDDLYPDTPRTRASRRSTGTNTTPDSRPTAERTKKSDREDPHLSSR